VITLPWPSKHLFTNTRAHWAVKAKHVKSARTLANWETTISKTKGDVLHLKFIPPHNKYDLHNIGAASCGKAYIDGVCDALGVNDKSITVTEEIGPAEKPGRVEITITKGASV